MAKLIEVSVIYLNQQIAAGAEVVQIFDSWAGDVPVVHRDRLVVEPIAQIVRGVRSEYPGFPVIVFARGIGADHGRVGRLTGASAVGVEQGIGLNDVLRGMPDGIAVQGNLDPGALLGSRESLRREVRAVVQAVAKERHIMNLGHGIQQQTDPDAVAALVAEVRAYDGEAA